MGSEIAATLEFEHGDLLITSLTVFFHKWEPVGPAVSDTVQAVRCELIFSWSGPGASKGGTEFIPIWTKGERLTRTTQQANHAPSPSEWGMRVGAAYTQTGVLAKGRAKGSAGEIEELGRKLGLAGASPPPKAGTRREAGTATQVP